MLILIAIHLTKVSVYTLPEYINIIRSYYALTLYVPVVL